MYYNLLKGVTVAKEPFQEMREKMLKKAKSDISSSYSNEEFALIQSINAYLETGKSYNLVFERLSEWYGLYYPEVKVTNPKVLADLAMVLNSNEEITEEKIKSIIEDEQKAASIYQKATSTMGRKMGENERKAVLAFAELSNQMYIALNELETYIKTTATAIMPNTVYLTDEKIAAELLSKAGSLERLATMPAGTVQLLGAEKALFKHIKFGSKPPKYGVLFKLPEVSAGARDKRGRVARVYATKISIALKADYFSKNFIAEKLKQDLEAAVKRINDSPSKPFKPSADRQDFRRQGQRPGQRQGPRQFNRPGNRPHSKGPRTPNQWKE